MRQLGNAADSPSSERLHDDGTARGSMLNLKDMSGLVHSLSAVSTDHVAILDAPDKPLQQHQDDGRCQDLRGALACILSPAGYSFSVHPAMGTPGLATGTVGSGPLGVGPAAQGGCLDTLPSDGVPSPARVNSLRSAQHDCALTEETSDSLRTSDAVFTPPHGDAVGVASPLHQQDNNGTPGGGGGGWPPPAKPSLGRRLLQSMLSGVKATAPAHRSAMAEELAASPDSSSHAGTRPATSPTPLVALTLSGTPAAALSAAGSASRPRSEVYLLAAPRAAAALDANQLSGPLSGLRSGEITNMPTPAAALGPSETLTDAGTVKGLRLVVPAMRRGTSATLGLHGLSATALWRSTASAAPMTFQSRTSVASTAPSLQQEQAGTEGEPAGRAMAMRVDVSGPRLDEVRGKLGCCAGGGCSVLS